MSAALRRLRSEDRGTSLTEMLIVMLILGIVIAAAASLSIMLTRANGQNVARQDQIDAARVAVERMSKTTRTAVKPSQLITSCNATCDQVEAFMQGGDLSMKFYGNLDNAKNAVGPSQITYTIASSGAKAGVLVEKVQIPDSPNPTSNGYQYCNAEATGASAECKSRLRTRDVVSGVQTSSAVFTFYGPGGTRLNPGAGGVLSAADLNKVLSVEITLTVQSDSPTRPDPTTYIQRITLPNAQAVIPQGEDD
ncbi:type II secretion system protein [Cellulomonas denverensis]|nr:type II secretion system protein [Cellulomonas denverensis]GIG24242.1 hypothetical protein Cde04nite_04860 [Cellulomonas denverensis]